MAATKRSVDFTNVKDAGAFNPVRVPAGDYVASVTKVDDHTSKNSKTPDNWVFTIQIQGKRGTYPYYCGFDEKQAWKIRNLLIAAGIAVPKKKVAVDPNKLVGKTIGIAVEDDEYEGKLKSVIMAVFPESDVQNVGKDTDDSGSDDADDDTSEGGDDEDLDLEEI